TNSFSSIVRNGTRSCGVFRASVAYLRQRSATVISQNYVPIRGMQVSFVMVRLQILLRFRAGGSRLLILLGLRWRGCSRFQISQILPTAITGVLRLRVLSILEKRAQDS